MGLTRFGVRSGDRLRYSYYNVVGGFFHLNKGQETNGYEAGDEDIMMKHFEGISLSETRRTNGLVSMITVVIETSAQLELFIHGSYIVWLIYCFLLSLTVLLVAQTNFLPALNIFSINYWPASGSIFGCKALFLHQFS